MGAIAEIVEEQKSVPSKKEIADLKDFILGDGFASYDVFYTGNKPKTENECRDEY